MNLSRTHKLVATAVGVLVLVGVLWNSIDWLKAVNAAAQAIPAIERDHQELKRALSLLPAIDLRLKKLEGVLELIAREKDADPKSASISAKSLDGPWRAQFRAGSAGSLIIEALDDKTVRISGKEEKNGGLEIKGTGEVRGDKLLITYRAISKKYPQGYGGKTKLTAVSATLLKGYFTNDVGEFDLITLTREE